MSCGGKDNRRDFWVGGVVRWLITSSKKADRLEKLRGKLLKESKGHKEVPIRANGILGWGTALETKHGLRRLERKAGTREDPNHCSPVPGDLSARRIREVTPGRRLPENDDKLADSLLQYEYALPDDDPDKAAEEETLGNLAVENLLEEFETSYLTEKQDITEKHRKTLEGMKKELESLDKKFQSKSIELDKVVKSTATRFTSQNQESSREDAKVSNMSLLRIVS